MRIGLTVNGSPAELEARADETLLALLRRELGLLSVRETCGIGVCGACTVLVDGRPLSACLLLAPLVEGLKITTAEGLPAEHRVVRAFAEAHAFQCGFCTPGMVLSVAALLEESPQPSDEEITHALAGNLCRCGCYVKIVDAVRLAAR